MKLRKLLELWTNLKSFSIFIIVGCFLLLSTLVRANKISFHCPHSLLAHLTFVPADSIEETCKFISNHLHKSDCILSGPIESLHHIFSRDKTYKLPLNCNGSIHPYIFKVMYRTQYGHDRTLLHSKIAQNIGIAPEILYHTSNNKVIISPYLSNYSNFTLFENKKNIATYISQKLKYMHNTTNNKTHFNEVYTLYQRVLHRFEDIRSYGILLPFFNKIYTWLLNVPQYIKIPEDPTLIHGDIKREHIMYNMHTNQPLLIDWGASVIGDPLEDLAQLSLALELSPLEEKEMLLHYNKLKSVDYKQKLKLLYYKALSLLHDGLWIYLVCIKLNNDKMPSLAFSLAPKNLICLKNIDKNISQALRERNFSGAKRAAQYLLHNFVYYKSLIPFDSKGRNKVL